MGAHHGVKALKSHQRSSSSLLRFISTGWCNRQCRCDAGHVRSLPGQRRRDNRRQAIVETPVDVLSPAHIMVEYFWLPVEPARIKRGSRRACPFLQGLRSYISPKRGPGVMHNFRADAVMQVRVVGRYSPKSAIQPPQPSSIMFF